MDIHNVANQMPYSNGHTTHKNVDYLEKQYQKQAANSAPSNVKHEQHTNSCHFTHICCLPACTEKNCGENIMPTAKLGKKQIRRLLGGQETFIVH